MEPKEIIDLRKWWNWIQKHPLKAVVYFALSILGLFLVSLVTGFWGEKGKQLAQPASSSDSPTRPENQETKEQSGDVHQAAIGNGNVQAATTGDNSPIIINVRKEELSHKIQAQQICHNKREDGLFITRVELYSPHPIPNVYFAAHAKTIVEFEIAPQRAGMFMAGHSGKREGFWFTNVPNFGGRYLLVVKTKESEKIEIEYDIK
jgi:hypothetical protein